MAVKDVVISVTTKKAQALVCDVLAASMIKPLE